MQRAIMKYAFFLAALILMPGAAAFSQEKESVQQDSGKKMHEEPVKRSGNNESEVFHYPLAFGVNFNTHDIFIFGGAGYFFLPEYMLSVRGNFHSRPYEKTVFIEKTVNRYNQYRESRFALDLAVDIIFYPLSVHPDNTSIGLFAATGIGYSGGNYQGSRTPARSSSSQVVRCGIQIGYRFSLRAGYQYFKVPGVPSNRLFAELGFSL